MFESQLADSLLEGDGQLAFKKLAAATVETLMPKIETKGEFGQARWRLVSAPQIPNLLSLDPTTDPFKSLANLSFGAEVEVQLGRHLQVCYSGLSIYLHFCWILLVFERGFQCSSTCSFWTVRVMFSTQ